MRKTKEELKSARKGERLFMASLFATSCCMLPMISLASPADNAVMVVQQKSNVIHGMVMDNNGDAIIGAYVVKKGERSGAVTDVDGKFTMDATDGTELVVS